MKKCVLLFSGGQDSTTCLYWAVNQGFKDIYLLSIGYGQKHSIEKECAEGLFKLVQMQFPEINFQFESLELPSSTLFGGTLMQNNPDFEQPEGVAKTWVPMRNMVFLTIAANRAVVFNSNTVILGVNSTDYSGYPDCRPSFITSALLAVNFALGNTKEDLHIKTPLLRLSKKQIVQLAIALGTEAYEALAFTHTCYNGVYPPCGKCDACLLRAKGFFEAGVPDPLILRAEAEGVI